MTELIITIVSIIFLFFIYKRFYLIRNLNLKTLEDWLISKSISEIRKELTKRMFNSTSSSNNKKSERYQRHKLDYIIIPTENYKGNMYIHYQLPDEVGTKKFLAQIKRKKYVKIENPNYKSEGFDWLGIEKTNKIDENIIFDEEIYIIDERILKQCFLYKKGKYSIIEMSNMSNHNKKSFLIYINGVK